MSNTASLKKEYAERIAPALKNQFQYSSTMQIPVLKKIVINQGLGMAVADKKIIEVAINELTAITGQKAVATVSRKDIANFKLRKKMPIGVMVTLRRERMYEFLEKLVRVALPRIRDFKGIESKFDGRGNYTLGIGYRGSMFYADLAYKYSTYKENFYPFVNGFTDEDGSTIIGSPEATKVTNTRSQVLFTVGMRF